MIAFVFPVLARMTPCLLDSHAAKYRVIGAIIFGVVNVVVIAGARPFHASQHCAGRDQRHEAVVSDVGEFNDVMDVDRVTGDLVAFNVDHVDEVDRVAFAFA